MKSDFVKKFAVGVAVAALGLIAVAPKAIAADQEASPSEEAAPQQCSFGDGPFSSQYACATSRVARDCKNDGANPSCQQEPVGWFLYCCYY